MDKSNTESHTEKHGTWIVTLEDFLEKTKNEFESTELPIPIGVDKNGTYVMGDLRKLGRILIAGSTGSGKSVFNHTTIYTLIQKYSLEKLLFIIADPKIVEMSVYKDIRYLFSKIETAPEKIFLGMEKLVEEKNKRLRENKETPYLVVIIDTFSDLVLFDRDRFEKIVQDLTTDTAKAGIHLIMCDSRPSSDVFTEKIKKCFPTKIAFNVASQVDSRVIIDQVGAEKLLGRGDMLFLGEGQKAPIRLQAPYTSDDEINKIIINEHLS